MILQGDFLIPAPRQQVWDAIWDIPTLASWVPGCTSAERISDDDYRVRLEEQVGFLKAAFDIHLTVVEVDPPNRIRLIGNGADPRLRSNVQIVSVVELAAEGERATRMSYRHDLSIFGRLGSLGFPLIQHKARETEAEFARRATSHLSGV